jgi:hypothetical protein
VRCRSGVGGGSAIGCRCIDNAVVVVSRGVLRRRTLRPKVHVIMRGLLAGQGRLQGRRVRARCTWQAGGRGPALQGQQ